MHANRTSTVDPKETIGALWGAIRELLEAPCHAMKEPPEANRATAEAQWVAKATWDTIGEPHLAIQAHKDHQATFHPAI